MPTYARGQMKHHIYHHNDLDGRAYAAIIHAWISKFRESDDEIHFYEMNYGVPFDDSEIDYENDYIYMVDFSLQPLDRMLPLLANPKFIWIDHHKTSCQFITEHPELSGLSDGKANRGIVTANLGAGCELTWEYYFGVTAGEPVPPIIKIISQYDTWNHHGPDDWETTILPIKMYLEAQNTQPSDLMWRVWTRQTVPLLDYIAIGESLLKFDRKRMAELAKEHMYEGEFCGLKALIFNTAEGGSSQFEAATDVTKYDIMVTYRRFKDQYWTVGLYSTKKEVDCSALAKKLGEAGPYKTGGGHPGAAGFQTDTAHISELLKF